MTKTKMALSLIVLLAASLRFYNLSHNPPSLNLDEVAIGYNAYSILKTGRDEYSKRFPFAFRSHDDYKPPLYIYLTVPSIAAFGLSEFGVRFPSAAAGTLTVFVTFFLTNGLLRLEMNETRATRIALLSALLLAVSPWHLQFSRAAFETNVAVLFTVTGTWAFITAVTRNKRWWLVAAIAFALALYTYQTARVFIPLFSIALAMIFRKSVAKDIKTAVLSGVTFLILLLPLLPLLPTQAGIMRFKGTSIFEHPGLIEEEEQRWLLDATRKDWFSMKLYHNRPFAILQTLANGYLKHFRPDLLFLGFWGPPVNYTPNVGLLYLIELPFMIIGALGLMTSKNSKLPLVVGSWMLLAPLASAFTIDVPSTTRMTIILPTYQILTALGLFSFLNSMQHAPPTWRIASLPLLATAWILSIGQYLHQYHVHAPLEFAQSWQYGYKQAVEYADQHKHEYDRVIVSTNLRQPQNFFAFYLQYDPVTYLFVDGGTVSGGFLETRNAFDKFEFHPIDYGRLDRSKRSLLIDLYSRMDSGYRDNALKVINLPNGEAEIAISRT